MLLIVRRSLIAFIGMSAFPTCQAFEWNGFAGPNFRSPASWTSKPPAANSANAADLFIANARNAPLIYSETDGKRFPTVLISRSAAAKIAAAIRLNGQPNTPDKFRFTSLPPQGICLLASS